MEWIAERQLSLRLADKTLDVVVRLGKPEVDDEFDAWRCAYAFEVGGKVQSDVCHGGDSMQALLLSIGALDLAVIHYAKQLGDVLWHFDEPFVSILEFGGLAHAPSRASRSTSSNPSS